LHDRLLDHRLERRKIGDRARDRNRCSAGGFDLVGDGLRRTQVKVVHHDLGAARSEKQSIFQSEPAARFRCSIILFIPMICRNVAGRLVRAQGRWRSDFSGANLLVPAQS
jgi:hypothetical protein